MEQGKSRLTKTVPLIYEDSLPSYFFETPFYCENTLTFPALAQLDISLDGVHFMETGLTLTILDSKVKLREIQPKFLSHKGGQQLSMRLDLKRIFGKDQVSTRAVRKSMQVVTDILPQEELELENILQENCGNLMIAFKQITSTEPTPNFKNLRNNSVIDNDLFLRQKMVLSRYNLPTDGLLEANNRQLRMIVSEHRLRSQKNSSIMKSNVSQSGEVSLIQPKRVSNKRTLTNSKRSLRESRVAESKMSEEQADETSGWKLVEAEIHDGVVSCRVPEIDLDSGKLIMFDKKGIMAKIRANDFNSSGRRLLEEVTQWLNSKSQAKDQSSSAGLTPDCNDHTINEIKRMFNSSQMDKERLQLEKNRQMLGFDLTLNGQKSLDERQMETQGESTRPVDDVSGFFDFWVDLCLNGQQILGKPFKLTFYKVILDRLQPDNCLNEGSIPIYFEGKGIFESDYQKVKIKKGAYERVIEPKWDPLGKRLFFYMPPFDWLRTSSQRNQQIPGQDFMVQCVQKQVEVFDAFANQAAPNPEQAPEDGADASPRSLLDKQFDIYLSLSATDWIYSGKVTYFEPVVEDFFPIELDPQNVETLVSSLQNVRDWQFFEEYFGADFTPLEFESKLVINFDRESTHPKEPSQLEPMKASEQSKSKQKLDKPKDKRKQFEAASSKIQNDIVLPNDYLLLLSRSGFIHVQSPNSVSAKFKHKKYSREAQVQWCNPHMLLTRVPDLPFSKPKPVPTEPDQQTSESQTDEKSKKKKKPKVEEWVPHETLPVSVQMTFNGTQFGPESPCHVNFMMIDSEISGEARVALRTQTKKGKKKSSK